MRARVAIAWQYTKCGDSRSPMTPSASCARTKGVEAEADDARVGAAAAGHLAGSQVREQGETRDTECELEFPVPL